MFIAAAALAVYWPSLSGTFIMDDDRYLTNNPLVASPDGVYQFWFTRTLEYYPVSNTSLWLEWRLWGMNPTGYRLTNLLLHVATALLVWAGLNQLSIPGAFLAALVFAIHPLNVQSVAWIAQRKEILAAFFYFASIVCYLRANNGAAPWPRRARGQPGTC